MLEILQSDTKQGTVTPTEIADNILNIMGTKAHLLPLCMTASIAQISRASNKSINHACVLLSGG